MPKRTPWDRYVNTSHSYKTHYDVGGCRALFILTVTYYFPFCWILRCYRFLLLAHQLNKMKDIGELHFSISVCEIEDACVCACEHASVCDI